MTLSEIDNVDKQLLATRCEAAVMTEFRELVRFLHQMVVCAEAGHVRG